MSMMRMQMFGRLQIMFGDLPATEHFANKVQELLCFILLARNREHSRDSLANQLWADRSTAQAKRNLRQLVYQLQSAFGQFEQFCSTAPVIVEPEWLVANTNANIWLDAWEFEDIHTQTRTLGGDQLDSNHIRSLQHAIQLYKGDLLEGWYDDWCIFERERFQRMYLAMLEKLMTYHEASDDYAAGVECGEQILRCDRAHERTHRRLMRMYCLAGDRTAALRQYEACRIALDEELSVTPADTTFTLYRQICMNQVQATMLPVQPDNALAGLERLGSQPTSDRLRRLREALANLQEQVAYCVRMIDHDIGHPS